jgi:hypothetical protein
MKSTLKITLIASCGMNCGICYANLREKNKCPGCRRDDNDEIKPVTRLKCRIKNCGVFKKRNLRFCFQCEEFPCNNLVHLDRRYRTKYNMSMIENLGSIRSNGIRKFIKDESARWTCPVCGGTVCVHKGYCIDCKKGKEDVD